MKTLKEHKARIEKAMDQDGPYTHNIISFVFGDVLKVRKK